MKQAKEKNTNIQALPFVFLLLSFSNSTIGYEDLLGSLYYYYQFKSGLINKKKNNNNNNNNNNNSNTTVRTENELKVENI
jgi:hypothetical protein